MAVGGGHHIAGRARLVEDDGPLKADQRIDKAALADVWLASDHHLPRLGQMQTKLGEPQQAVDPRLGLVELVRCRGHRGLPPTPVAKRRDIGRAESKPCEPSLLARVPDGPRHGKGSRAELATTVRS